ncbi:MAG: polyribonucleotide nucleotidyltransferase [Lentisphaerae bacterium]|nr:polyribonucleotide nucleotidyltransferase [Lentisphaerota bacterium]
MNQEQTVTVNVGGKDITLSAGLLARQAAGATTIRIEDTLLFSAVTCAAEPREGIDYFPMQVEYREKFYAAGRFPGGFFKRESRPAEKEVLAARMTDRPIRPLFPKSYRNDVQINNMVLSADGKNDPDVLSVTAASASLTISAIPFLGPIAAVRVCRIGGEFIINPTHDERDVADLDMVYASTRDLPLMIEGGAKEVPEDVVVAAMRRAHPECVKLIDAQLELRRKLGLPDKVVPPEQPDTAALDAAREFAGADFAAALDIDGKIEREDRISAIKAGLRSRMAERFPEMTAEQFRAVFDELEIETVRAAVLDRNHRVGGRGFEEIRPLHGLAGILPRAHGSALFSRGETQAVGTVTLGTKSDTQGLDAVTGGPEEKQFMLHYNFPPYSVGEVGRLGSTGRREIGHGALAERSLQPILPPDYPYTVRLVSDIMGSNGSSSMASVCVGSLALMDAGIPVTRGVAGISIGLFTGPGRDVLVTDIIGAEDHCGDMDFKVAGTSDGITGFQVDLKIPGLKWELVEGAFGQARRARRALLDFMSTVIAAPRADLAQHAPRIRQLRIDPEKIGELIGPGGKNIRRITDLSGAQIDIEDDGTVSIFATSKDSMDLAVREVEMVTAEPEVGMVYEGVVTGIKEFGAFVQILPGKDGLVHISELADYRVGRVEDICRIGDRMTVKCLGVDERGKVRLSRRALLRDAEGGAPEGAPAPDAGAPDAPYERRERPPRSRDRRHRRDR